MCCLEKQTKEKRNAWTIRGLVARPEISKSLLLGQYHINELDRLRVAKPGKVADVLFDSLALEIV